MTKRLAFLLVGAFATLASCAPVGTASVPKASDCQLDQASENPLHDARRISDMQVWTKKSRRGNPLAETKQGVAIVLRPERGLTLEWLTHVVECDAATPHPVDTSCPLSLPTAHAAVDSSQGHLVVYVRYTDQKSIERAIELAQQFRGKAAD